MLRCTGFAKRYGQRWALRDATFTLGAGEMVGLIGPNGAGKTTLFECVAGVLPATAGMVRTDDGAPVASRKRVLFYVPDGVRPWPDQTAGWVLRFMAGLHGIAEPTRREVERSLALEPLLGARTGTLSKGEHKRLMLAMGLLTPQALLMIDEPFDGLDLRQTREAMRVLRDHAGAGRTLLLSIHQLNDAERACDRLILLSEGRIVGQGTLDELRAAAGQPATAALEEVFLALA